MNEACNPLYHPFVCYACLLAKLTGGIRLWVAKTEKLVLSK